MSLSRKHELADAGEQATARKEDRRFNVWVCFLLMLLVAPADFFFDSPRWPVTAALFAFTTVRLVYVLSQSDCRRRPRRATARRVERAGVSDCG